MSSTDLLVAGVDVGGTNIEVGLVDDAHDVHARTKAATPEGGVAGRCRAGIAMCSGSGWEPASVEGCRAPSACPEIPAMSGTGGTGSLLIEAALIVLGAGMLVGMHRQGRLTTA